MADEQIIARYLIETPVEPSRAAEVLAGEQSSGTFIAVPGETYELRRRHRATVVSVRPLGEVDAPSLPGGRRPPAGGSGRYQRAEVEVAFPVVNVGHNLPTLLATVTGNLYELAEFSGVKLLDLHFPPSFEAAFPGPAFGIGGTRKLCGVVGQPILGRSSNRASALRRIRPPTWQRPWPRRVWIS